MNKLWLIVSIVIIVAAAIVARFFVGAGKIHKLTAVTPGPQPAPTISQTREVITPTAKTTAKPVEAKTEKINLEFKLTGSIIHAKLKSAFILNTLTNNEQTYQEGDYLHSLNYGKWTIYKIGAAEVVLHQYYPDGSIAKEKILRLMEGPAVEKPDQPADNMVLAYKEGEKKLEAKKPGGSINLSSPQDLDEAMKETSFDEMMGLVKGLPESLIQSVLNKVPEEYIKQKLQDSSLGYAISEDTYKNVSPVEIVNDLRQVAADFTPQGDAVLLFAAKVNADNSPMSPTTVFTTETRRIYACFRNEGAIAKLDTVIIKWMNISSHKLVQWGAYKLDVNAPYNFIYLSMDKENAWEKGRYLVTIYKQIQDLTPIVCGQFDVK